MAENGTTGRDGVNGDATERMKGICVSHERFDIYGSTHLTALTDSTRTSCSTLGGPGYLLVGSSCRLLIDDMHCHLIHPEHLIWNCRHKSRSFSIVSSRIGLLCSILTSSTLYAAIPYPAIKSSATYLSLIVATTASPTTPIQRRDNGQPKENCKGNIDSSDSSSAIP